MAAALFCVRSPGVIDQDLTHQPRGNREEVRTILERQSVEIHEAQVCFMNERGGLKRLSGALPSQARAGYATELSVDQRNQRVERRFVTLPQFDQETGDVVLGPIVV